MGNKLLFGEASGGRGIPATMIFDDAGKTQRQNILTELTDISHIGYEQKKYHSLTRDDDHVSEGQ